MPEILLIIGLFLLYFLPVFVAAMRDTQNSGGVFVINVFLGWTFLGWVIALAMAAGGAKKPKP